MLTTETTTGVMLVWTRPHALERRLSLRRYVVPALVLSLLVGLAFIGFYNPAWSGLSSFNPLTHGISVLGHVDDLRPVHLLAPIAILLGFNAAVLALGALRARHLEV